MTEPAIYSGIDFQGRDPGENFLFYFRQHWVRLVLPMIRMILWLIALLAAGYLIFEIIGMEDDVTRRIALTALLLVFAVTQWIFMRRFYVHFLYVIVVSDRKVHRIKKTFFAVDDHQCVDLAICQDIHRVQHGIIQTLLKYGSIFLEAQDTELRLHFVPHVSSLYAKLLSIHDKTRQRMEPPGGQS